MEINRHEEIVEVVEGAIITYTVDPRGLKCGAAAGTYIDTGMLSLSCSYVDGELDGLYTEYHENGLQKLVGNYTLGKRNGVFTKYDECGIEIERCEYIDDLRQGVCVITKDGIETTSFYVNDMKQGEETVYYTRLNYLGSTREYKDNKQNGWYTTYHDNGKKERQVQYINDIKHGTESYWNYEGVLIYTIEYINGVRNGICREYYDNGKVKSESPYVDGKIQGERVKYWDNGTVKSRKEYIGNEKQGKCMVYYISGALMKSWTCVYNHKHGSFVHYHENGKVSLKGVYENGRYQGQIYSYYYDGTLQSIEKFLNGSRNGHQVFYNEDGSKAEEYILYRGNLHKIKTVYGDNGKYKLRTMYDNGKRVWEEEYRNNGSLYTYSEFVDGHRHGEVITYYDRDVDTKNKGIVWMRSLYLNGSHIKTTAYNPDGSVKYKSVKGIL